MLKMDLTTRSRLQILPQIFSRFEAPQGGDGLWAVLSNRFNTWVQTGDRLAAD